MVEFLPVTLEKMEKPRPPALSTAQIASLVAQTGCLVFVAIFAALGLGILLDRTLHTRPFFMLVFVLGSMPLTLFVLYRLTLRAVSKVLPTPPAEAKGPNVDDDES